MVTDLPKRLKQDILLVMNLQQVTLLVLPDLRWLDWIFFKGIPPKFEH